MGIRSGPQGMQRSIWENTPVRNVSSIGFYSIHLPSLEPLLVIFYAFAHITQLVAASELCHAYVAFEKRWKFSHKLE